MKHTFAESEKQKGAWFYVSANEQKGCLHGNTLRYENTDTDTNTRTDAKTKAKTESDIKKEEANPGLSMPRGLFIRFPRIKNHIRAGDRQFGSNC